MGATGEGCSYLTLNAPQLIHHPQDRAAFERSRLLASYYRTVAEELRLPFVDAGELVAVSPVDGVHLDAEGQQRFGKAIAEKVAEMLGVLEEDR